MKNFVVNKKMIWVIVFAMLLQCLPLTTLAATENNKKNKVSISDRFSKAKTSCFKTFKVLTDADYARAYRRQVCADIDYKEKLNLENSASKMIGQKTGKERTKGIRNFNAIRLGSAVNKAFFKAGAYMVASPAIIGSKIKTGVYATTSPDIIGSKIKVGAYATTSPAIIGSKCNEIYKASSPAYKLFCKTKSSLDLRIKNYKKSGESYYAK